MKTTHVILEEFGDTRKVQIDLIAETQHDEIILNRQFAKELQVHVLLWANSLFTNYTVLYCIDTSNSPRRTILLMEKTAGI